MKFAQKVETACLHLRKNRDGNVAIIFAIAAPVMLFLIGVAIDFSNAVNQRTKLQASLDASVLAIAADLSRNSPTEFADYQNIELIREIFKAESEVGTVDSYSISSNSQSINVTATARYEMKTHFASIIGKRFIPIEVTSAANAPKVLTSFKIMVKSAAGLWSKSAEIVGEKDGLETVLATARYTYIRPGVRPAFTIDDPNWIDIQSYDDVFIRFTVFEDSYRRRRMCGELLCPDIVLTTRDPLASNRMYIDGVRQKDGIVIKFEDTVECGSQTEHAWEDGGGHGPDFHYNIEGKCEFGNPFDIYLTK